MTEWQFGRIYTPDEAWLAKAAPELILEPELPIIDPHHHLWQRGDHRYLLDELLADLNTGHNVVATVFEECQSMYRAGGPEELRPVGETEFVAGIGAMSDSGAYGKTRVAAGIVGFVDLTLGDQVEPVLLAQIRAGNGRFRGTRHAASYDPDPIIGNSHHATDQPGLYRRADFRAGLARLSALGLVFDAWLYHPQIGDVIDLAQAFPATPIVMGHVGGFLGYGPYAGRRDEEFAKWRQSLRDLSQCPNVVVKLGGMVNRGAAFDFHHAAAPPSSETIAACWRPFVETCIELFGADRCMFESNYPVDKMGIGYVALWNAFKRIAAAASADEKRWLFSGTAARTYRLSW
jgi:predicted TIM-barrel fold metal-dependent hydrolase